MGIQIGEARRLVTTHFDFLRSFVQFSTTRINHTPRLQVDAVCRLVAESGDMKEYALTTACVGERMYASENLVQVPPFEFLMIAGEGEFLMQKTFASGRDTVREAHRVGDTMSTHDGLGAVMRDVVIELVPLDGARELTTDESIREAMLRNSPIQARTTFTDVDGRTRVELLYPVKICNVSNDSAQWQVDTGRVPFPSHPPSSGQVVARFEPAYILFNARDWADVAILAHDEGSVPAPHYTDIRRVAVENELYAV